MTKPRIGQASAGLTSLKGGDSHRAQI